LIRIFHFVNRFLVLDQEYYRKLISGEIGGLGLIVRFLLPIICFFYGISVRLRNFLYTKGLFKIHRVDRPVISVGNITTGGTGKTPFVILLCKWLSEKKKIAILTRGYKAGTRQEETNQTYIDEPQILAKSCPGVEVIINPDRLEGAREAIRKFNAEVLLMDDGFQHRRLGRDVDIVMIDATKPFGYGWLLPAGLLREPICGLRRADAVVITRCDQVNEIQLKLVEQKIQNTTEDAIIARSAHKVVIAKLADGEEISPERLKGKRIFAFCGIGNPVSFIDTIHRIGCKVVGSKIYNDHHHYTEEDIREIFEKGGKVSSDLILTTQKDWTKIEGMKILYSEGNKPIGYLEIALNFISGEEKIRRLIEKSLAVKIMCE
jgi:tetraacyldisaccharide 4'-kinase